ncbi:hypothetical protein IJU97_06205 [bacterium]|nr:hypothetical protein [bacterium]
MTVLKICSQGAAISTLFFPTLAVDNLLPFSQIAVTQRMLSNSYQHG